MKFDELIEQELTELCKQENIPSSVYAQLCKHLDNDTYLIGDVLRYGYLGAFVNLEELATQIIENMGGLPDFAEKFFDYEAFVEDQKEKEELFVTYDEMYYAFLVVC